MKNIIKNILNEETEGLRERFIRSAESLPYIIESVVDSKLITGVEIKNIKYDETYNTINCELIITSWHEDPEVLTFRHQLGRVNKEIDRVLMNYSFTSNGVFGKNKGKNNNLMWWFFGCEWNSSSNNDELIMKYEFRQEEYGSE